MPRRVTTGQILLCAISLLFLGSAPAAARDVAIRALNITVKAHPYIYLEVGTAGPIVDQISFRVTTLPGTGPVRGQSTGVFPVPVVGDGLLAAQGLVTLTANAATPMQDGKGNQIPFSQVYWTGSGDIPSGQFSGAPQQIIMQRAAHKGRLKLEGAMIFFYSNQQYFPAGTYTGQVTYTLTAP